MRRLLKFGAIGCGGLVVLIFVLAAIGNAGSGARTPTPAAPVAGAAAPAKPAAGPAPTVTTAPAPTTQAAPTTPPKAVPTKPAGLGSGTHLVGTDVQPGTYRSNNAGAGCYWARLSGVGGTVGEILANDNASGPAIVTIAPSDKGFTSTRCAPWVPLGPAITTGPTEPFGPGTFAVNTDIAPGTWRSAGAAGCYWARLKDFAGGVTGIIANDNASGPAVVQIAPTDAGFTSSRCGTWTKIG